MGDLMGDLSPRAASRVAKASPPHSTQVSVREQPGASSMANSARSSNASSTDSSPLRRRSTAKHGDFIMRKLIAGDQSRRAELGGRTAHFGGTVKTSAVTQAVTAAGATIQDDWGASWKLSGVLLGAGAKGKVYLALNTSTGELCAVKSLPFDRGGASKPKTNDIGLTATGASSALSSTSSGSGGDADGGTAWAKELGREVTLLAKLNHPNMVGYKSFSVARGVAYIVMEYVSGGSLNTILENFGALDETAAISYILNMLEGIAYLHGKDVIHGDIKLGNVLVDTCGTCKIADFGTSRYVGASISLLDDVAVGGADDDHGSGGGVHLPAKPVTGSFYGGSGGGANATAAAAADSGNHADRITVTFSNPAGTTVGSPLFMAPEQARGKLCKASDIWSVGLAALQLLTNELPYGKTAQSMNPMSFIYKLATDDDFRPTLPQRGHGNDVSDEMVDFLSQCLTRNMLKRATANELLQHRIFMPLRRERSGMSTPVSSMRSASGSATPLV